MNNQPIITFNLSFWRFLSPRKGLIMYYKYFFSEGFLIHSITRFSHIILEKERLLEVFNLAHSYGRWEIKTQRDETTFPESQCVKPPPVPRPFVLSPDFTAPLVIFMMSYWDF